MALTCLQILKGAARKLGVLPIGRELTAAQGESGMEMLQSLYLELVGQGVFGGAMVDTLVTDASYDAHEFERVICDRTVTTTINLPTEISTEWCPTGGYIGGTHDYGWSNSSSTFPRAPIDNAIIQIADQDDPDNGETHIYDAPRAAWVEITGLLIADPAPLSERYGEALKALLAEKWAPDWNVVPPPALSIQVTTAKSLLSHRYDRNSRAAVGNYF